MKQLVSDIVPRMKETRADKIRPLQRLPEMISGKSFYFTTDLLTSRTLGSSGNSAPQSLTFLTLANKKVYESNIGLTILLSVLDDR